MASTVGMVKGAVVTGHKEVDAALAGLEPKIQRKAIRGALRKGTKEIVRLAKANLILSPSIQTRALYKSLAVRSAKRSRSYIGMRIDTKESYYAGFVEFGTQNMPAEPFLRPAGYGSKSTIGMMLVDDVKEAIAQTKARPLK